MNSCTLFLCTRERERERVSSFGTLRRAGGTVSIIVSWTGAGGASPSSPMSSSLLNAVLVVCCCGPLNKRRFLRRGFSPPPSPRRKIAASLSPSTELSGEREREKHTYTHKTQCQLWLNGALIDEDWILLQWTKEGENALKLENWYQFSVSKKKKKNTEFCCEKTF